MPAGRPPIFKTPEEMQELIDDYFSSCDSTHTRYTIPGIAYHLGFSSRTQFPDYAKDRPEFSDTVSRARLKIECQRSGDLIDPDTKNVNGIKFDLTNNFGYHEKMETEHSGNLQVVRVELPQKKEIGAPVDI